MCQLVSASGIHAAHDKAHEHGAFQLLMQLRARIRLAHRRKLLPKRLIPLPHRLFALLFCHGDFPLRCARGQPLRLLRLADPDMPVKLAVEAANTRAQRLYRSLGFRQLPERDGDDLIFCMEENPDG